VCDDTLRLTSTKTLKLGQLPLRATIISQATSAMLCRPESEQVVGSATLVESGRDTGQCVGLGPGGHFQGLHFSVNKHVLMSKQISPEVLVASADRYRPNVKLQQKYICTITLQHKGTSNLMCRKRQLQGQVLEWFNCLICLLPLQ